MARKRTNITQNERRARYKQGWRDLGINDRIITRNDLRNIDPNKVDDDFLQDIKTQSRVQKTRETKAIKAKQREELLISKGYKKSDIKKSWLQSDKKLYDELGITNPLKVYRADYNLALAFTPVNGADSFRGTSYFKKFSFEKLKDMIRKRVANAEKNPGGSNALVCVFQFFTGTESACEDVLEGFSQRGYNLKINKLTDKRYHRLFNRNDWTMREFAELTLAVITQCHNRDVPMYIQQLRDFVELNDLPFLEIFE